MTAIISAFRRVNEAIVSATNFTFVTRIIFFILTIVSINNNYFDFALLFGSSFTTTIKIEQMYRLITNPTLSHVVSGAQFQVIMDCFGTMELEFGSVLFSSLLFQMIISINYLHLQYCTIGHVFSQNEDYHWDGITSLSPILLAMTMMKCSSCDGDSFAFRQLLLLMIPHIHNVSIPNILGLVVGYLFGRKDYWKMNAKKVQKWEEEGWLQCIATRPHYVAIVNSKMYKMEEEKQDDEIV